MTEYEFCAPSVFLCVLSSSRSVFACEHSCTFKCEATPINTVMAHHNFYRAACTPENSLRLNQNVLFIQGNRFTVNWFIEIAFQLYYVSL